MRQQHIFIAGLAVSALVALSACGAGDSSLNQEQVQQAGRATASQLAQEGVRHEVRSHCGIVSTTFEGELWLADPPLGDHNPPPGWDENDTPGLFVQRTATEANFKGNTGVEADFIKAAAGASDPAANCA